MHICILYTTPNTNHILHLHFKPHLYWERLGDIEIDHLCYISGCVSVAGCVSNTLEIDNLLTGRQITLANCHTPYLLLTEGQIILATATPPIYC